MLPIDGPIGIFDSGLGGLSVAKEIKTLMPQEDILYIGDNINAPYGPRPKEQIITFSSAIADFLMKKGAKIIVVACNTASAAALASLRQNFSGISFIGMEPAIKPASESTRSGKIGVLATPNTFSGDLYNSTLHRFAEGKSVMEDPCPGLVQQIEAGELETIRTREILTRSLRPMMNVGVDTIVLGCTHYPFVMPLIREIVGEEVRLINPAPAVAKQTQAVMSREKTLKESKVEIGKTRLLTTGDLGLFSKMVEKICPGDFFGAEFGKLSWHSGVLNQD